MSTYRHCGLLIGLMLLLTGRLLGFTRTPREGTLHRGETLVHDGKMRRYHFYETHTPGERPLVMVLHGGGGRINRVIGLGASRWPHQVWLDLADEAGIHILVPQGLNRQWNDGRNNCTRCGTEDDSGFLMRLLEVVERDYGVNREQIFVLGESNGGFMTQRLAMEQPERFAGFGVIIAQLPVASNVEPQNIPVSIMYQLGTEDAAVRFEGGASDPQVAVQSAEQTFDYWRSLNSCEEPGTVRHYPDIDPDDGSTVYREDIECSATGTQLSFVVMEGAGHVPPSTTVRVSRFWEAIVGRQNHDVESARLFWEFFYVEPPH